MVLLCSPSIFEKYISKSIDKCKGDVISILFNPNVKFLLTKDLIEEIEKNISDLNIFQGLIRYLYDSNKIEKETIKAVSTENIYLTLMKNSRIHNLFLFSIDESEFQLIPNRFVYNLAERKNVHWILNQLLTNKKISLNFHDFKNNKEIEVFFESIFSLPNFIKKVKIFDREKNVKFLQKIKGKDIEYYSFLKNPHISRHIFQDDQSALRKNLGGKLKLFVTGDKRVIHERKVFIDKICITLDNSFNNILVEEPTWNIFIEYNHDLETNWSVKCQKFKSY